MCSEWLLPLTGLYPFVFFMLQSISENLKNTNAYMVMVVSVFNTVYRHKCGEGWLMAADERLYSALHQQRAPPPCAKVIS